MLTNTTSDADLLVEILPVLEIDLQVARLFEAWDKDGIAQFRRVGRKAVRSLGHRAFTRQTDPERREDGRVVVIVACDTDEGDPDRERVFARSIEILPDKWQREGLSRPTEQPRDE